MCFGGDSGGGNTSTVVQSNTLPPVVDQGYQQLLAMGTAGANIPYTAYTAPRIAGFTDMQNQGFAQTGTAANAYQPYLDQSQQYTQAGAQPIAPSLGTFDQSAFQQYGNPYTQDVINSSNQEIQRQGTIGNQTIAGNAAQAGAFGGDRATVAQTENNRNTLNTIARNTDTLNQQNFQQAQGQFNTEQNRGLAAQESDQAAYARAAGAEAALGGQAQQQGLSGASALLGAGAQQQQMNQSGLNLAYSDFKDQQLWPQEQATYLNSIVHGLNAPTSSTTTSPGPSIAGQVGGLAATGIGAIGATGGFGATGWLAQATGTGAYGQAAADVGNSAYDFFADGGTVDPDNYPGPDTYIDPSNDTSVPGGTTYNAPIGPEQTQLSILSDMSDRQLVAARNDPQFSPSLVDQQLTQRGIRSPFGNVVGGIGDYVSGAARDAARRVSAANQVPPPSAADIDATRNIGPAIGKAATDIGNFFTKPVLAAPPSSERNVGDMPSMESPPQSERAASGGVDPNQFIPPAGSERYGRDPIPAATDGGDTTPPTPAASDNPEGARGIATPTGERRDRGDVATPSGIAGGVTLAPGGARLLPDGNQRPLGSPGAPPAPPPPAPPQAGIGGPPPGINRNGIAPPAPLLTGARVPPAAPAVVPPGPGAAAGAPVAPPAPPQQQGIGATPPAAQQSPPRLYDTDPNTLSGLNPWLALAKAGGQMAASKSPFALTAAGEGALAGVGDIEHQQQIRATAQLKNAQLQRQYQQDDMMHADRIQRSNDRQELTRQQAQWHQDEIAARREAASERSDDRKSALMLHADSLRQNQQLAQQRIDELARGNDQKAENAADARTKNADIAEQKVLRSLGVPDGMAAEPGQRGAAENHIIDTYPDTPQGKAYKAARETPAAMPTDKTQAIPRQIYTTKNGPMRWTGTTWEKP